MIDMIFQYFTDSDSYDLLPEWERNQRVLRAWESGCPKTTIAKKLKITRTEVSSIIIIATQTKNKCPVRRKFWEIPPEKLLVLSLTVHCLLGGTPENWTPLKPGTSDPSLLSLPKLPRRPMSAAERRRPQV